jgi:hypothetical protein
VFSVVGNILIDSEAPVVTLPVSSRGFADLVFDSAYRGRVCQCALIEVSVRAFVSVCVVLCNLKLKLRAVLMDISQIIVLSNATIG